MTDIAVVGAGLIGRRHAEAVLAAPGVRLSALVDPAPEAAALAQRMGVPHLPDLEALLAGPRPDGVILATPNTHHVPGGLACIAAGLPVLVEKPLATDIAGARRLVEAAEAAGVPLLTGHHRGHNPIVAAARARIAAGEIGRPVSAHVMYWICKPDPYFDTAWRRAPGAGPVYLNLSHDIDLMRHLLGEIDSVQAMESSAIRGNAVEESAVILLRFASGALGTVNISDTIPAPWSWEMTTGENPAYPRTDAPCYFIGGTAGSLEMPLNRLWHDEGKRDWWAPISARMAAWPEAGDPLLRQVGQFARVIRGEEAPLVSGREGLATLAVVEAVKQAAASGTPVTPQGRAAAEGGAGPSPERAGLP
ncbi:Gfo/Idh/MocA family oxidoreductase (plasmid) [Paroceanicella profunda]|uniref:Gfo/Idh/MocA family oxidoreductase n=1 Tax=Paroceanicella profunda TaxID=2579971 RepID=A0A5B8G1H9_9RHOB|nr:Gfo/Idh/MocA family oxidoreductase [Paroceanicella profunda]QDL94575.1 Gfo/Idh/MocA family oxidoreductase [Paroceanicella profunda]